MARPSDYTPELANRICAIVAENPYGLKVLCQMFDEMPDHKTIKTWRRKYPEFLTQYLQAKELQGLEIIEDLWEESNHLDANSDEINLFNARFRFQQFHLAKLAPKQFGDRKHVTSDMNVSVHEQDLQSLK